MTVVFDSDDAIYGVGRFGTASYGVVSPTKIITGVAADFTIGDVQVNLLLKPVGFTLLLDLGDVGTVAEANISVSGYTLSLTAGTIVTEASANVFPIGYNLIVDLGILTTIAEANTTLTGLDLSFVLGDPEIKTINRVDLVGVSASFAVGVLQPNLTTFLSGFSLDIPLGTVSTFGGTGADAALPSFPLQIQLNDDFTITAGATFVPTGYNITFVLNNVTSSGVVLSFLPFANDFSRKRTVYLPKADTRGDRTARTEERY